MATRKRRDPPTYVTYMGGVYKMTRSAWLHLLCDVVARGCVEDIEEYGTFIGRHESASHLDAEQARNLLDYAKDKENKKS